MHQKGFPSLSYGGSSRPLYLSPFHIKALPRFLQENCDKFLISHQRLKTNSDDCCPVNFSFFLKHLLPNHFKKLAAQTTGSYS